MSTTTEHTPTETPTTETEGPLPDYATTVAKLGDPQPTIDELTADLDAQTPPVIDPDPDLPPGGKKHESSDAGTAEDSGEQRDGGGADD